MYDTVVMILNYYVDESVVTKIYSPRKSVTTLNSPVGRYCV